MSRVYIPKHMTASYNEAKTWNTAKKQTRIHNKKKVSAKDEAQFCLSCTKASCPYGNCDELKEFLRSKRYA